MNRVEPRLSRAGLARHLDPGDPGSRPCSALHDGLHQLGHLGRGLRRGGRRPRSRPVGPCHLALGVGHLLQDVGLHGDAPVGHRGRCQGHPQGRGGHVLLADGRLGQARLVLGEGGSGREKGLGGPRQVERRRAVEAEGVGLIGERRSTEVKANGGEPRVARDPEQLGHDTPAHLAAEVAQDLAVGLGKRESRQLWVLLGGQVGAAVVDGRGGDDLERRAGEVALAVAGRQEGFARIGVELLPRRRAPAAGRGKRAGWGRSSGCCTWRGWRRCSGRGRRQPRCGRPAPWLPPVAACPRWSRSPSGSRPAGP